MNVLHDAQIRDDLCDYFEQNYEKVRFFDELLMGRSRADIVMVIESGLVGVEIKSDADTYERLSRQVQDYDRFFDYNYAVIGASHAHHPKMGRHSLEAPQQHPCDHPELRGRQASGFSEEEKRRLNQRFSSSSSIPFSRVTGLSVGAKRSATFPSLSIRNLAKFHWMRPGFCSLRYTYSGAASLPFTLIFSNLGNFV